MTINTPETDKLLEQLMKDVERRLGDTFTRVLNAQQKPLQALIEGLVTAAIGGVFSQGGTRSGSFLQSAAQQGADLLATLEKAKRNV